MSREALVFQVRRIGDLFQSIPLLDVLSESGNRPVDVVVDDIVLPVSEVFSKDIKLKTYKDILSSFSENDNKHLKSITGFSPSAFLENVNNFLPFLHDFASKYDLAVNLNYDLTNALFLPFFGNKSRGAYALNKSRKDLGLIARTGPSNYLYNLVRNRKYNRLNITDIFSLIGSGAPAAVKKSYNVISLNRNKETVVAGQNRGLRACISVGATSPKRLWPPEYFASLINIIHDNFDGCEFTVVGTSSDAGSALKIREAVKEGVNLIDLTGKTTLSELVYLIKDFDLIVASDTGTLHIAQAFGIPSVAVFTGNANFYETGPSVEKSVAVYSKIDCYPCFEHEPCRFNYACLNDVKPQAAFNAVLAVTEKKMKTCLSMDADSYLKHVFDLLKDASSKGGFSAAVSVRADNSIHFYPVEKRIISKEELASEILKFCWLVVLSENNAGYRRYSDSLKYAGKYYTISMETVDSLINEFSYIKTVFEEGSSSFAGENISGEDQAYCNKFMESVKSLGVNYPYFKLACDYFHDELNFAGAEKAFKDLNVLAGLALKDLTEYRHGVNL